jgi:hypothetical protein
MITYLEHGEVHQETKSVWMAAWTQNVKNLLASCSTILNTVRRFTTFTSHVNFRVDVRLRMLRSQLLEATRILMTVFPSPQGVLHTPRSAGFKRSEAPSIKPRLQVGKGQYLYRRIALFSMAIIFLVEDYSLLGYSDI